VKCRRESVYSYRITRRTALEKYSIDENNLKHCIVSKVEELVECVLRLGKTELFQITVKYNNGELITDTYFMNFKTIS